MDTLGQDNHLQFMRAHQASAQDLLPCHLIAQELGDGREFFLVQLEDIGPFQALADGMSRFPTPLSK